MTQIQNKNFYTIDLNFMDLPGTIASYLIPHSRGCILVECGPGSTIPALEKGLSRHGFKISDISDVLLTHIHLDHAGASGWLASQGATIHVHPVGAAHMLDPEKLLASAERIYGDLMKTLWGEFLPVKDTKLKTHTDEEIIQINEMQFRCLDTPGHANHHYAYLWENICFSGDIGGVRLSGTNHLRVPMPPPEFILERWQDSVKRLIKEFTNGNFNYIAPTHFGVFDDPAWHLNSLDKALKDINSWIETVMPTNPSIDSINEQFLNWTQQRAFIDGMPQDKLNAYEAANPSWMSGYGIQRYWRKYRSETPS